MIQEVKREMEEEKKGDIEGEKIVREIEGRKNTEYEKETRYESKSEKR